MAVIECRSCGAKVNAEAAACPECGADPRTGDSLLDWPRLTAANPEATRAEAQKVRESALPIGLCIAGGVWALVVWAVGSHVSAMIGLEAADPDPPKHTGLLLLMLTYVAVAGLASWAAARMASDPRSGGYLALAAFGLGYLPPALAAAAWHLIEFGHIARDHLVPLLALLWTLGGWTLAFAAVVAWRRARMAARRIGKPAPSDAAVVMAAVGVCTTMVLVLIPFVRGRLSAQGPSEKAVSSLALQWALAGGIGAAGAALLRRHRVPGMILLAIGAVAGFCAVASAPPDILYQGGRRELLATWVMAALPFCLSIAIELSERSGSRRPIDWRYGAGVVLACFAAFVAIWLRPEFAKETSWAWAWIPDWDGLHGVAGVGTLATVHGGLLIAAVLAFVAAAVCFWRPLEGAVVAGTAAAVGLAAVLALPPGELWGPGFVWPSWRWVFVWLWSFGLLALGSSALFSYRRWRASARPEAASPAPGPQVAGSGAAGTLSHAAATTSNRGDDVNDDHDHQTPGTSLEPGVDAGSGTLERHCSQCGALIEGSHEFCQVCALESSGGELPPDVGEA